MPKKSGLKIDLDLLRPQSEPQRVAVKVFKWLLSSGRFLIIAVEIIVLGAFLFRFKLDADIASTREAIEQQIPFIESLAEDERLIKETQFQLSSIKSIRQDYPDYPAVLDKLAKQTPTGVSVTTLSLEKGVGKISLRLTGSADDNNQLASFIAGLKSDSSFEDLNLSDVSFEGGSIGFSVSASVLNQQGEKL